MKVELGGVWNLQFGRWIFLAMELESGFAVLESINVGGEWKMKELWECRGELGFERGVEL